MSTTAVIVTIILASLGFITGVIIGCYIHSVFNKEETIGNLRIDESDPDDRPYLFLELEHDPDSIKRRKRVTLNVRVENYISQK